MLEQEKIEEVTQSLKIYVNTNYQLAKLQATERASIVGSGLIGGIIIGIVGIFFILFMSVGISFYISSVLGNDYSGFGIVSGFYLLLGIVLIIGRKKMIENPIRDKIVRKVLSRT